MFGDEGEEAAAAAAAPGADGLGAVITAERAAAVNAAVAKLPERYRVPLALAYYADADYDQIAATLKITRTHVGVLLFRAKQLLRQSLERAEQSLFAPTTPAPDGWSPEVDNIRQQLDRLERELPEATVSNEP